MRSDMKEFDENEVHCEMYLHLLWSTKDQKPMILPTFSKQLCHFISEFALENECSLIASNAPADHIQLLIKVTPEFLLSNFLIGVKAATTMWIRTNFPEFSHFKWQNSDCSFSVSFEEVGCMINKINQSKIYIEEVYQYLDAYCIQYDVNEVLD